MAVSQPYLFVWTKTIDVHNLPTILYLCAKYQRNICIHVCRIFVHI